MPEALYDRIGIGYSRFRQPDPRIAAHLSAALGAARGTSTWFPVLNWIWGTASSSRGGVVAPDDRLLRVDGGPYVSSGAARPSVGAGMELAALYLSDSPLVILAAPVLTIGGAVAGS